MSAETYQNFLITYGQHLFHPNSSLLTNTSSLPLSPENLEVIDTIRHILSSDRVYSSLIESILIVVYAIIALSGIFSNSLVFFVIISSPKLMRNPSSSLLLNLMLGDILMSIVCIPFTLFWIIRRSWPFGEFMCKLVPLIQGTALFVTSFTIATIAVDRMLRVTRNNYCSITSASSSRQANDYHWVQITCETLVIWSISFLLALPAWLSQEVIDVGIPPSLGYEKCVEAMPSESVRIFYAVLILVSQYVIPAVVLLVANRQIKKHLQKRLHVWNSILSPPVCSSISHPPLPLISTPITSTTPIPEVEIVVEDEEDDESEEDYDDDERDSGKGSAEVESGLVSNSSQGRKKNNFIGFGSATNNSITTTTTTEISGNRQFTDRPSSSHHRESLTPTSQLTPSPSVHLCHPSVIFQENFTVRNSRKRILKDIERNRKVLRTLARLATAFMVCWLPFNVWNIYLDLSEGDHITLDSNSIDSNNLVVASFYVIAMSSIPINAFLYGWLNPCVRTEFHYRWASLKGKIASRQTTATNNHPRQQNDLPQSHSMESGTRI